MTLPTFDQRGDWHYPVCRYVLTVTVPKPGTNAETDLPLNMKITQVHFVTPALDLADTAELILLDADDRVIAASGEKAESATHQLDVHESVCGVVTFRVECSAQQDDNACIFTIYVYGT